MKRIIAFAAALLTAASIEISAQNVTEVLVVDSAAVFAPLVDSTLVGVSIMALINDPSTDGRITVNQSGQISNAFYEQISKNQARKLSGYRIRIYFDNNQNARTESERIASSFAASYPYMRVYRSHVSPYFKVTVGDFRTKDDAQKFAKTISGKYPSAFLVKENINFPDI